MNDIDICEGHFLKRWNQNDYLFYVEEDGSSMVIRTTTPIKEPFPAKEKVVHKNGHLLHRIVDRSHDWKKAIMEEGILFGVPVKHACFYMVIDNWYRYMMEHDTLDIPFDMVKDDVENLSDEDKVEMKNELFMDDDANIVRLTRFNSLPTKLVRGSIFAHPGNWCLQGFVPKHIREGKGEDVIAHQRAIFSTFKERSFSFSDSIVQINNRKTNPNGVGKIDLHQLESIPRKKFSAVYFVAKKPTDVKYAWELQRIAETVYIPQNTLPKS